MIVPFLPGLVSEAARLHRACFSDDPWPVAAFSALLGNDAYGFGWVEHRTLKGLILARNAADEAEILTFAVHPASRRQGIGTQLVLALSARCEAIEVRSLFLEVAEDNQAARGLYAALGFEQIGARSGYYRSGTGLVDALVMVKKFERRYD